MLVTRVFSTSVLIQHNSLALRSQQLSQIGNHAIGVLMSTMEEIKEGRGHLFRPPRSARARVVLNWTGEPDEKFEFYGESFLQAAIRLEQAYDGDGPHRDFAACPIVFLLRHALELYLKGFILAGDDLLALNGEIRVDRNKVLQSHALLPLLAEADKVTDALGWDWEMGDKAPQSREEFAALLAEFDCVDRKAYAFRYPTDPKGAPALPSPFDFDLSVLLEKIMPVCKALDSSITGAQVAVHNEREMREYT